MIFHNYLIRQYQFPENDLVTWAVKYLLGSPVCGDDTLNRPSNIIDGWIDRFLASKNIEIVNFRKWEIDYYGKLMPKGNSFQISLRNELAHFSNTKRFTLAHEIGHILAYTKIGDCYVRQIKHSESEEHFCGAFAREALLPKALFDANSINVNKLGENFEFEKLQKAAEDFKIFPWQILKKILETHCSESHVGILWIYSDNEGVFKIGDKIAPYGIFIPQNDRLFVNELFERLNASAVICHNMQKPFTCFSKINIGTLNEELHSTTVPLNVGKRRYLAQIISLNEKLIEKSLNWRRRKLGT